MLGCSGRTGRAGIVASVLAMVLVAGCGGDDNKSVSPKTLKADLPPASDYHGFRLERTFEWDNPIDVVVDGIPLPESTERSVATGKFEDAGFEAGAGERLRGEDKDVSITIAQFGSEDQAREILRYVQKEGLKQPCEGACSEEGAKFDVPGIPGALGAQQTPQKNPPPHAPPPFSAYGVGFTVGPKFYLVQSGGPPGAVKRDQVIEAAQSLYKRVRS